MSLTYDGGGWTVRSRICINIIDLLKPKKAFCFVYNVLSKLIELFSKHIKFTLLASSNCLELRIKDVVISDIMFNTVFPWSFQICIRIHLVGNCLTVCTLFGLEVTQKSQYCLLHFE